MPSRANKRKGWPPTETLLTETVLPHTEGFHGELWSEIQ